MPNLNPQDDAAKLITLCRAVIKSDTDKVAAILVLRKRCGLGLREAKTWVEDHYDAIFRDPSMSTAKNIATRLKDIRTRHDAGKEGWDIFETSDGSLEIQAIIDAGGPQDDVEATEHVIEAAKGGNVDALRALVVLLAHIAEPVIDEAIRLQAGKARRLGPFAVIMPDPACATASMATTGGKPNPTDIEVDIRGTLLEAQELIGTMCTNPDDDAQQKWWAAHANVSQVLDQIPAQEQ